MMKKKISILLVIVIFVAGIFVNEPETAIASTKYSAYYKNFLKKFLNTVNLYRDDEEESSYEIGDTVEIETEIVEEDVIEINVEENTTNIVIEKEVSTENVSEEITSTNTMNEVNDDSINETTSENIIQNEIMEESITSLDKEEIDSEKNTVIETESNYKKAEEETTKVMSGVQVEVNDEVKEKIEYYQELAKEEADWLWSQQMSNGAFAFYNEFNGNVRVNPYFSEIVAIALINYDNSVDAKNKIKKYMDWHFAHINSSSEDYNGLAGTIYDYTAVVKNGIVISESTKKTYDSTDSYSALFIKVLADYAKVYGDTQYIVEHKETIKDITNVIFANLSSNGYSYAKPDYKIRYLMDNSEVYAGLVSAKYIYSNIIDDSEMVEKINKTVEFFDANFNKHWWKGDHYAPTLSTKYEEHNDFSWNNFYPNATAQMFPVIYDVIDSNSNNAKVIYSGLCNSWDWQDMDYISEGVDVFCWGSFALLGAKMNDVSRFDAYMNRYKEIVDGGRLYPLYSSESAMVLMGLNTMIENLQK